jgi:L-alanine-DL-glutamate epimerase-like enolase superfamily enzyme
VDERGCLSSGRVALPQGRLGAPSLEDRVTGMLDTLGDAATVVATNATDCDQTNDRPDYSAASVILRTDADGGLEGHGMTFTTGRGNELCVAAIRSLESLVTGRTLESITSDLGRFWSSLVDDGQLRWVGPEKGVIHLATAALVDAVWDLYAKTEGKPVWKLLADMTPEEIVRIVPFRYITDALTPDEAIAILTRMEPTKSIRENELFTTGSPAYTTSSGWLGYPDDKVRRLCREGVAAGWRHFKLKLGRDPEADIRRAAIVREEIGDDRILMVDANQVWDVDQAIDWMRALAPARPLWIEEPTSPDDVLGHARIAEALGPLGIRVATGEHCHNRVMFKQFLQARPSASAGSTAAVWAGSTRSWQSSCWPPSSVSPSAPTPEGSDCVSMSSILRSSITSRSVARSTSVSSNTSTTSMSISSIRRSSRTADMSCPPRRATASP